MSCKVVIAGGRDFCTDHRGINLPISNERVQSVLALIQDKLKNLEEVTIISGGARGADTIGEYFSIANSLPLEIFKADWDKHGKSAGYIRNAEMAKVGTHLIVFWDGESKGTKHMIDLARKEGLKVKIFKYKRGRSK